MKIAMTGVTGGLGMQIALGARRHGHEVRALVRSPAKATSLAAEGITLVEGDLARADALERTAEGADAFVHAAAHVGDEGTREEFERVNVGGTRSAVEAAARQHVRRFVQISSVAVYGRPERGTIDESFAPLPCDTPYEATKRAAEELAFQRGAELGLEVTAVRPPIIYGPSDRQFLPRLIAQLRRGLALYIDGGRARLNVVSTSDVVDVVLRCCEPAKAVGEVFNVAAYPPPTVRQVFDTVADAAGLARPRLSVPKSVAMPASRIVERAWHLARRPGPAPFTPFVVTMLTRDVIYDASKARRLLGWDGGHTPLEDLAALARAAAQ
jgi:nucleoside-diphosphate-sugar epimerase